MVKRRDKNNIIKDIKHNILTRIKINYQMIWNKNILFIDFNWVISYKNFWYSLEKKDEIVYTKINNFLFKENKEIVQDWMLWKCSSRYICEYLSKNLEINNKYLYKSLIEDCKNIDLSEEILLLLKKLKKYYSIVLVTDNMDCFSDFTVKYNPKFFKVFDWIFNSSQYWYFKNNAYTELIKKHKANINLSYLIDDSFNNCNKFEKLGGNSINPKWEKDVIKWLNKILSNAKNKWIWQF